jgi:hypothetical protein
MFWRWQPAGDVVCGEARARFPVYWPFVLT